MRILFMGTPEFALAQLAALYEHRTENGWEIVGAVSQPDKPKGRGNKLLPTPVKEYALSKDIPVFQPETLKNGAFADTLNELNPDLIVVAAYGKILPGYVLEAPKYGCINVHGSILPAYRGAAPIQRAIMDGIPETGVTIQFLAAGIDTGDVIASCRVKIGENEDFGTLYAAMAEAGAELLVNTVPAIEAGTVTRLKQDESLASYAHKIEKEECALDFSLDAYTLHNKLRALSPSPLAFASLAHGEEKKTVKFVSSEVGERDGTHGEPGTVLSLDAKKNRIAVACGKGILILTAVVPEGKGKMTAGDFIRGRKIAEGDRFGNLT